METTAYHAQEESLGRILKLARCITGVILEWANMLCCHLKVGAPYVLYFHFSDTTS